MTTAQKNSVIEVFKAWDQDGSGVISCDELKLALQMLNPALSQQDTDTLFRIADRNNDGVIEYDEFVDFLCSDELATQIPDALFVIMNREVVWSHYLPLPRRVAQVVVGPHSAYALFDDGSCWQVGPSAVGRNDTIAPRRIDALCDACGPINYLGIDYLTLFAVAGGESKDVWMYRPDEEFSELEGGTFVGVRKAESLSGLGVVDVRGDQSWGMVTTVQGCSLLYAHGKAKASLGGFLNLPDKDGQWHLWNASASEEPQSIFAEIACVPAGSMPSSPGQITHATATLWKQRSVGARRIVMTGHEDGALLVTKDGSLASLGGITGNCAGCLDFGTATSSPLGVQLLFMQICESISGVVDVTSDGNVALDADGNLWRIRGAGKPLPIAMFGDCKQRINRFAGEVALARAAVGEEALAIGQKGCAWWARGLRSFGSVQSGGEFSVGFIAGLVPPESHENTADLADFWHSGGANMLARRCGRETLPEQGVDLPRLKALLADGCDPNAADELFAQPPLLLCFARRASQGEPGMCAAAKLLVEHGADVEKAKKLTDEVAVITALNDAAK